MATSPAPFDAYHKLLGIPPAEQPPNHYRLLGISLFENDPDVIDGAASRQMAHVQKSTGGPHAVHSQKLLSELAAARLCLLNQGRKEEYDRTLKEVLRRARKEKKRSSRPAKMKSERDANTQSTTNTETRDRNQPRLNPSESNSTPVPTDSAVHLPRHHWKISKHTVIGVSCIVLAVVAIGTFLIVRSSRSVAEPVQLVESPSAEPLASIEPTVEPKQAFEPEPPRAAFAVKTTEAVAPEQERAELPAHSSKLEPVDTNTGISQTAAAKYHAKNAMFDNRHIQNEQHDVAKSQLPIETTTSRSLPHNDGVRGVAFDPSGSLCYTSSLDGFVRSWRLPNGELADTFEPANEQLTSIAISPNGKYIAGGTKQSGISLLWNASTGKLVKRLKGGEHSSHNSVAFSPDSRRLVFASGHDILVWDVQSGRRLLNGKWKRLVRAEYVPSGNLILAYDKTGSITYWDTAKMFTFKQISGLLPAYEGVPLGRPFACSSDGKFVLATTNDASAHLYDMESKQIVTMLAGHSSQLGAVSISSDGLVAVTGAIGKQGNDTSVRFWNTRTGKEIGRIERHPGAVADLAMSPNNKYLVTCGFWGNNNAYLWKVPDLK